MENHGGMMMSTEEHSRFIHQSSLAILPAQSSGSKQEEWEFGLVKYFCFYLEVNFTFNNIL
jgi:hypothetical protein